jgi:hypothetical protein
MRFVSIQPSLWAWAADEVGKEFSPIQYKTTGIHCEGKPVCALVAEVYESEGWHKLHADS